MERAKSKCTPSRLAAIIELTDKGHTRQRIAELVGVTRNTIRNWFKAGREGEDLELADFATRIAEIDAERIDLCIARVSPWKGTWNVHG